MANLHTISQINFEDLQSFVNKRSEYLKGKENLISLYEGEKGINNDYKGRQLLELIQNADDAESSIIKIIIDTKESKLQIINEGIPFSFGGFQSLMVPNLSTKRKKKYIGNKGLGFRSILNWSKKVTISSGGCVVSFSPEFAKKKI
ncbi:MAG: ATP-binding protein [Bacteroidetes bacterium]|nr:ATP-binding protein [Bacteroidota bacterium]